MRLSLKVRRVVARLGKPLSKAASCFLQHFTTVTCWHFISTHFLRASLALIFPVLTSLLRCRSSMVKRTRLERSVITVRDKDGCRPRAARTRDAVSAAEAPGSKVKPRSSFALISHLIDEWFHPILHISSCICVSFLPLRPHRATVCDQAPHLVYLTSWIWHSVSVSVSLSNTPSEVSLVDLSSAGSALEEPAAACV